MVDKSRIIHLSEVEKHNTPESCWITMNGKVYDVSKFLSEHPGGEEVITELAGKDATVAFLDVGHSKDAQEMTEEYQIGVLPANEKCGQGAATAAAPKQQQKVAAKPGSSWKEILTSPTWSNFLIPSAIGILVYFLYKGALKLAA